MEVSSFSSSWQIHLIEHYSQTSLQRPLSDDYHRPVSFPSAKVACRVLARMAWRQFLSRSVQQVKDETARVMRASPIEPHGNIRSLPLASFVPPPASPSSSNVEAAKAEIRNWATGADGDIGGMSWCRLEPYSPAAAATSSASASGIASGSMSQAPATEASGSTSSSTAASPALRRNLQQELDSIPNLDSEAGARFYGNLSSQVRQGMKLGGSKVDRSGYAGIRTKVCRERRSMLESTH